MRSGGRGSGFGFLRETSLLLPVAVLLLVLISTFTLLSYRSAIRDLAADEASTSSELRRQSFLVARLTWVVVPSTVAITLLVLLYMRRLLTPYERLLDRARASREPDTSTGEGDEVDFLVETFERAIAALEGREDSGQIRELQEALQQAEERQLAETLGRLGELTAGLAHELRNGLATVHGYLELLERGPGEEAAAEYLVEMKGESDHLLRVLDDFLSFARPGTARMEELDLAELVRSAARDPALASEAVEVRAPRGIVPGRGDRQLIVRALRNLLHNAVQAQGATNPTHPVTVRLRPGAEGVRIEVEDRGAGLSRPASELMQPFVTTRSGGTGLGLALTQRIVALHGGTLALEEPPGGGTLATIELPAGKSVTQSNSP